MLNSLEDIVALLKGTELENSTKVKLDIPGSSTCAFAIKVNAENSIRAWIILRSLLNKTGRYPVLAGQGYFVHLNWAEVIRDIFTREEFLYEVANSRNMDVYPKDIIERSKKKNFIGQIEQYKQNISCFTLEEIIDQEIEYTYRQFGVKPRKESVITSFPLYLGNVQNSVVMAVENWLFNWELKHINPEIALKPPDIQYLYLDWYPPEDECDFTLVLLPTFNSWETLAYIHWFGAESSEVMIALFQSWHEHFKAELLSHDGLNLLFNVYEKPRTPQEAFQLAVEHKIFAGDTLDLAGISIRDHARVLLHLDRWCLSSQP